MSNDRNMAGTRFGRVATPRPGEAIRLDDRVLGQNARKQKLSMASGTNPAKEGDKGIPGAPRVATAGGAGGSGGGYAQDTAPHKAAAAGNKFDFSVGGPGFPKPWK